MDSLTPGDRTAVSPCSSGTQAFRPLGHRGEDTSGEETATSSVTLLSLSRALTSAGRSLPAPGLPTRGARAPPGGEGWCSPQLPGKVPPAGWGPPRAWTPRQGLGNVPGAGSHAGSARPIRPFSGMDGDGDTPAPRWAEVGRDHSRSRGVHAKGLLTAGCDGRTAERRFLSQG